MTDQMSVLPRPVTAPSSYSYTQEFVALPTAPRLARALVKLAAHDQCLSRSCAEAAELVMSELVTQAVFQVGRGSGPPAPGPTEQLGVISVQLHVVGSALRIEVWDDDRPPPEPTRFPVSRNSGNLFLVEHLSTRWGAYTPRIGGKVVWAEMTAAPKPRLQEPPPANAAPLRKRVRRQKDGTGRPGPAVDVVLLERALRGLRQLEGPLLQDTGRCGPVVVAAVNARSGRSVCSGGQPLRTALLPAAPGL